MRIPRFRRGRSKLEQDPHEHEHAADPKEKVEAPKDHPWEALVPKVFPVLRGTRRREERVRPISAWRTKREGRTKREAKNVAYPSRWRRERRAHGRQRGR